MCGISGFSGPLSPELLAKMNRTLAHRGPDGEGVFHCPRANIGLAHRRLSILDLSEAGAQPMWDETGSACIVYNGELYNSPEIRQRLLAEGVSFRGTSDTEVLINLYRREGPAMLTALNGIFAFAIYDRRSDEVLIARDRFGVKPLYFAQPGNSLVFASEIKALLQCKEISSAINPAAVMAHVTYLWCPAPMTILDAVQKVEPGQAISIKDGQVLRRWRFYEPPVGIHRSIDEREAIAEVRAALQRAVRRQMISDVPVGAFLSGGIDSSAVAAFARQEMQPRRLQCFTVDIDSDAAIGEGMTPDLPYARSVAKYLDVDLHVVKSGSETASDLESMIYHLDEPQADPAALIVMQIARLAQENGIKVLLSGVAADDLFGGYRRHRALAAEPLWNWLPRPLRAQMSSLAALSPAGMPFMRRLGKAFRYAGLDQDERIASYFYWLPPEVSRGLLHGKQNVAHDPDSILKSLSDMPHDASPLDKMLALEVRYFLGDHNLLYNDKMSMAASVETRVPFLDNDLAELAFSLPGRFKQRNSTGKWVLRQALAGILPDDIIDRPKTGFAMPLRNLLHGPMNSLMLDIFSSQSFREREIFDTEAVAQLVEDNRMNRLDASYSLYAILSIELWCRAFLDDRSGAI